MRITLLGAGHIGQTIARLLADSGDYEVTVVDRSPLALAHVAGDAVQTKVVDTAAAADLLAVLRGQDAVINALPYHLATLAATAARDAGCHYFDLTEDVAATERDPATRRRRAHRLHAAMRAGAGLHRHRRPPPGAGFRRRCTT